MINLDLNTVTASSPLDIEVLRAQLARYQDRTLLAAERRQNLLESLNA